MLQHTTHDYGSYCCRPSNTRKWVCASRKNSGGQLCVILAVPPLTTTAACVQDMKLNNHDQLNILFQAINKEHKETASKKKTAFRKKQSKQERMIKFGFGDSATDSVKRLFLHAIHTTEKTDNTKLLKYSYKCSNDMETDVQSSVYKLGSMMQYMFTEKICISSELKSLMLKQKEKVSSWGLPQTKEPTLVEQMKNIGHSMGVIGWDVTTPVHKDNSNASLDFGGFPDYHICLTDNPNIAFLVYVPMTGNRVMPILIVRRKNATTFFGGGSCYHGSVHIRTYLSAFASQFERQGICNECPVQDEWFSPVGKCQRQFLTFFTRVSVPMIWHTIKGYEMIGKTPLSFCPKREKGKGQLKKNRSKRAIRLSVRTTMFFYCAI